MARIKLNLTIKEDTGLSDWWGCDHSINLHDKYDRATDTNWVTHEMGKPNLAPLIGVLYLHEIGHRLGLPDTYIDPDCPDREPIMPRDDVMNHH